MGGVANEDDGAERSEMSPLGIKSKTFTYVTIWKTD